MNNIKINISDVIKDQLKSHSKQTTFPMVLATIGNVKKRYYSNDIYNNYELKIYTFDSENDYKKNQREIQSSVGSGMKFFVLKDSELIVEFEV